MEFGTDVCKHSETPVMMLTWFLILVTLRTLTLTENNTLSCGLVKPIYKRISRKDFMPEHKTESCWNKTYSQQKCDVSLTIPDSFR